MNFLQAGEIPMELASTAFLGPVGSMFVFGMK